MNSDLDNLDLNVDLDGKGTNLFFYITNNIHLITKKAAQSGSLLLFDIETVKTGKDLKKPHPSQWFFYRNKTTVPTLVFRSRGLRSVE